MKRTILAAALALAFSGADAADLRFEVLGGQCELTRDDNGVWHNTHYQTNVNLRDTCFQLGASATPWKLGAYNIGWRAAYVDFGRITTDSVMAARDEDQPHNPDGKSCDRATMENCLIRTIGGGHARGVSLGGVAERAFGPVTIGAELGALVYYNNFTVAIHHWPANEYVYTWDLARGWMATPYAGATLQAGAFIAAARVYTKVTAHQSGCGGCSGIANGPAYQFTAGVTF